MRLFDRPCSFLVPPPFDRLGRSSLFLVCQIWALWRPGAPVHSFFLSVIFGKSIAWSPKLVTQASGLRNVLVRCCVKIFSSSRSGLGVVVSSKLCLGWETPESQCCVGMDGVMRVCYLLLCKGRWSLVVFWLLGHIRLPPCWVGLIWVVWVAVWGGER